LDYTRLEQHPLHLERRRNQLLLRLPYCVVRKNQQTKTAECHTQRNQTQYCPERKKNVIFVAFFERKMLAITFLLAYIMRRMSVSIKQKIVGSFLINGSAEL
jgi:hypothetical protein